MVLSEEELNDIWNEMAVASKEFRKQAVSDPVAEWRTRCGQFSGSACGHVCTNECTLTRITADLFGCTQTGAIHTCGIDHCTASVLCKAGNFVCGITGYELDVVRVHEWSPAQEGDIPTGGDVTTATNAVQYKKRRYSTHRTRRSACWDVILSVVKQVLLNPNEGKLIEKKRNVALAAIRRGTRTYEQECAANGELPNMAVVEDIAQRHMMRSRLWGRERCSEERLHFYVGVIYCLWETVIPLMTQNRTETHMKTFALGCLYKLQHGFAVHGNNVIPEDDWLAANLPLACDIQTYGFPKRFVTVGRNVLLGAFQHLVRTNQLKSSDLDITRKPLQYTI